MLTAPLAPDSNAWLYATWGECIATYSTPDKLKGLGKVITSLVWFPEIPKRFLAVALTLSKIVTVLFAGVPAPLNVNVNLPVVDDFVIVTVAPSLK